MRVHIICSFLLFLYSSCQPQNNILKRRIESLFYCTYIMAWREISCPFLNGRSPLVNWGAYELGLDLTMARNLGENPHPFGQIPCLVDTTSGATLFESGACLNYLESVANVHGATSKERGAILSWIAWANASLDPICFLETPDGKVYVQHSFVVVENIRVLPNSHPYASYEYQPEYGV